MTRVAMLADLDRRRSTLEFEISAWHDRAINSPGELGLHKKQLGEIKRALDGLMSARTALVNELKDKAPGPALADAYIEVLEEIVGAGELWRIYQTGIEQHSVSPFRDLVHEATLTAAELTDSVFAVAAPWGAKPAPAMIYLDPALSLAAGGRFTAAGDSGFVVRRFRAMRLPVPLLLVPADQSTSYWSLTHLVHEVGHNLDQELGPVQGENHFTLTRALKAELNMVLTAAKVPADRIRRWLRWSEELLADLFGLSLGGAGFASALSSVLLPLAEATRFSSLDGDAEGQSRAPHPPPLLRQRVLLELVQLDGSAALVAMRKTIETDWANVAVPGFLADLAPDLAKVAQTLWDFPIVAGGKKVRELAPFIPDQRFEPLVDYLAGRTNQRPAPSHPDKLPRVHVALAAELARRAIGDMDPEKIHQRALAFARTIPSPQFAEGVQDSVKERAVSLRFSAKEAS